MYQHITNISTNNSGDNLILETLCYFVQLPSNNGVDVMNTNDFIEGKGKEEKKKRNVEK